jgi:caa(3)-type oxidase subunit IV
MSRPALKPLTYVLIDLVLVALTILTVGLSFVPEKGVEHLVGGLVIALVKASFVVLFFMHAIYSRAHTRAVIIVTIFWLVVVMFALTFSDYTSRGLIPNLPGH